MIFEPVNLQQELRKQQKKLSEPIHELIDLLNQAAANDKEVLLRLSQEAKENSTANSHVNLDKNRIFTLDTINEICIKYRLRFLDSKHFKGEFPYAAIAEINKFEKEHKLKIGQFKLLAPAKLFNLEDSNEDPLLFAQIGPQQFYLLHQWGKDLKWYRALVNFPLRSIYAFFLSSILFAALVAISFPFDWLNVNRDGEMIFRFWLTTHFTIAFFFFFLFLGSLSNSNFSDCSWNSKYFNS
jgi:hypothetical protein